MHVQFGTLHPPRQHPLEGLLRRMISQEGLLGREEMGSEASKLGGELEIGEGGLLKKEEKGSGR